MKKNKLSILALTLLFTGALASCNINKNNNSTTIDDTNPTITTESGNNTTNDNGQYIPFDGNLIPVSNKEEHGIELDDSKTIAYTEGASVEFNVSNGKTSSDYDISYTYDDKQYIPVDKELLRINGTNARLDILGLTKARYKIKIVDNKTNDYAITKTIDVIEDDRSGYAHFNNKNGVGAYKNDGTLKDNAVIVYVTDETKNTVSVTIDGVKYTGLSNIIKACDGTNVPGATSMASTPLDIRIIGEIKTTQWNKINSYGEASTEARINNLNEAFDSVDWNLTTQNELSNPGMAKSDNYYKISEPDIIKYGINSMSEDENKGITKLNGLTNNILKDINPSKSGYLEYDSYYNELDVKFRENITIEGVGNDAKIFQWGFCFNQCNSIEVKNIEFSNYTEDAIGIQGSSGDITKYSDYWIHNCTFNSGKNNWDVSFENDKKEGDGSTDFKSAHDLTISYCRYNKTHKTALVGSGSTSYQYNITFHHNFYNECGSRLPFTRNSNFHIYNCYYLKSTGTNMQIESNAYAFIEQCYFDNTNKTFTNNGGVIKLYKNIITGEKSTSTTGTNINYVDNRTTPVTNNCKADKVTDYSTFDTNKDLFYYDDVNNISKVDLMLKASDVKSYIPTIAGAGLLNTIDYSKNYKENNSEYVEPTVTGINYTSGIPTSSGWYGNIQEYPLKSDGKPDTANGKDVEYSKDAVVSENEGKITLTDTSSTKTTFAYYIFDETYTTGKHTYTINISLGNNVGSKWSLIQFLDGDKNLSIRDCGIDSNNKNKWGYSLDGGQTEVASELAVEKEKTYNIVLTIDYTNETAEVSINDTKITITNWNFSEIKGIQFMTAASAQDRSFTVNKVEIE